MDANFRKELEGILDFLFQRGLTDKAVGAKVAEVLVTQLIKERAGNVFLPDEEKR